MPPRRSTLRTHRFAREMRKEPTPAEGRLWAYLRNDRMGVSFRRQYAIEQYVADFCWIKKKLIIEVDGGQHVELSDYDRLRSEDLSALGYKILRFWNRDVTNDIAGVIRVIQEELEK